MCSCDESIERPHRGGNSAPVTANPVRIHPSVSGSTQIEISLTGLECPIRKKILALLEEKCPVCGYNFAQK